ncbi:MAG: hypothetical protein WDN45_06820 [Caulobacteraceae bacterium]
MTAAKPRFGPPSMGQVRRMHLRGRRAWRLLVVIAAAVAGGVLAVLFAKLCDLAGAQHLAWATQWPLLVLILPPVALPLAVWLTMSLAPEAGGSGIPPGDRSLRAGAARRWARPARVAEDCGPQDGHRRLPCSWPGCRSAERGRRCRSWPPWCSPSPPICAAGLTLARS